jgi:amidohydrolase
MPIKNRFSELYPQITAWRQDLHRHPELMFDTHRTAAFVAQKLREFGCDEVVTGLGRTGVVGVIRGRQDTQNRTVGLRADMDALPIHEETGLDYASQTPGAMHACGHDGHTAMLLGAAQYLAQTRNFDGTAVVIFQPAEEGGGGGREMVQDGLIERWNIQEVYGLHNWPDIPAGQFAIRSGPFFAAADQFTIEVEGKGGHAAKPHQAVDTTVVASHIVLALQTIVSRNVDPTQEIVVSVTAFETDTKAHNVIPQRVKMKGTVRTITRQMQALAMQRMDDIVTGTAAALGARGVLHYHPGYPVMVNADAQTEYAAEAARRVTGDCAHASLVMGGEDFAYLANARPGGYILLGNGDTAPVHHPEYNFNDEIIPVGCSWWAEIVEMRMPIGAETGSE